MSRLSLVLLCPNPRTKSELANRRPALSLSTQNIGHRRGHRYKHSSISAQHQIFQELPPRAPPVLPASLPVPTVREAWASIQPDQRTRLAWCVCHGLVAMYVFFSAGGSLAMTGLSHLVFFDVGSAAICAAVDVLGNFEVWRRSSMRHPFGLQRAEVLAGFAMSIFLVFGGFDLLSHNLKHVLESVGHHEPHVAHSHGGEDLLAGSDGGQGHGHGHGGHVSPGAMHVASLAAALSTLVSAYGLRNHGRIRRVMRVSMPLPAYLSFLPDTLSNPFHGLTLFFSAVMLVLPLLSVGFYLWFDRLICAAIAVSMFVLGTRLAVAQGLMLLMSHSGRAARGGRRRDRRGDGGQWTGKGGAYDAGDADDADDADDDGIAAVMREIEAEPSIARVEEAQFWQVHYGLCMASLKVCIVRGCDDGAVSQLRSRVARVIQNRLGEGYGRGSSLRWEVTLQTRTDGS